MFCIPLCGCAVKHCWLLMFLLVKPRVSAPLDLGIPLSFIPQPLLSVILMHSVCMAGWRTQTFQPHRACWSYLIQQLNIEELHAWAGLCLSLGSPASPGCRYSNNSLWELPLWHLWRTNTDWLDILEKKQPLSPVQAVTHPNQDFAAKAVLTWFDLQFLSQIV